MPILDWLGLGESRKAKLQRAIEDLADRARRESERQALPPPRAAVWETLCDGAAEIVHQLLTRNAHRDLDWGLKGHRGRIDDRRLAVIYWWMLLYHLVMFKSRGLDGYDTEVEFPALRDVAQSFCSHLASAPEFGGVKCEPWENRWQSQVSLEASMAIYNRTLELLGLPNDLTRRINRVSLFTTATERGYTSTVSEAVHRRIAAGAS